MEAIESQVIRVQIEEAERKLTEVLCRVGFVREQATQCATVFVDNSRDGVPSHGLNNAHVRVLEFSSKPGQKEAMHSHPAVLIHAIQGGKLRSTTPDGTSKETEYKAGDVMWRDAITHSGENIGTTEVKSLLVEMKQAKKK